MAASRSEGAGLDHFEVFMRVADRVCLSVSGSCVKE